MGTAHICLLNLGSDHWLGGRNYFENIVRVLARCEALGNNMRLSYVISKPDDEIQKGEIGRLCNVIVAPQLNAPSPKLWPRGRRYLQRRLLGYRHPVMHEFLVSQRVSFAFPCAPGGETAGGYRTAHWIADLQFKHFPQFQLPQILKAQEAYLSDIAQDAATVVVSSRFGAKDCLRFYPAIRERLFVMPFRIAFTDALLPAEGMDAIANYNLPSHYVLVCNQFWQNKNHRVVFEATARLKAAGLPIAVVCTGHVYDPRLPNYCDCVHAVIHELGIAQQTFLLGAVPRSHQVDLMRKSAAVLQPSLFEGWNTSIEEARALGRPVIASDIPVHREQAWEGMRLFPPDDADALADALRDVWLQGEGGSIDLAREFQLWKTTRLKLNASRRNLSVSPRETTRKRPLTNRI